MRSFVQCHDFERDDVGHEVAVILTGFFDVWTALRVAPLDADVLTCTIHLLESSEELEKTLRAAGVEIVQLDGHAEIVDTQVCHIGYDISVKFGGVVHVGSALNCQCLSVESDERGALSLFK